jgi:transposase
MISADEYRLRNAELQAENLQLKAVLYQVEQSNLQLRAELEKQAARITELVAQVNWFQKQIFGQKSERRIIEPAKEQLFLGEQFKQETAAAETQTVQEHERKKRRTKSTDGDDEKMFFDPEVVPVEEVKVPNPEVAGLSADEYEVISQKETYRLAQLPGTYVVIKYVRDVVKIKSAAKNAPQITCPAVPESVFEKSHADVSFLAGMLIDKFLYHLPLHRQHLRLKAAGIEVSRSWLTQLVHRCGNLLEPIFEALVESIRGARVKLMDETPIKAGLEKKGKLRDAYFWPVMAGSDIVFLYFDSREHRHVFEALGANPQEGSVIVSDGYGAYKAYAEATHTLNPQCWTHSRREFVKAEDMEPVRVKEALDLIRPLYRLEDEIKKQELSGEAKRLYRVEHSKPVVDIFFAWVDDQLKNDAFLPSNPLTKALNYVNKRKDALMLFLNDPEIPIDTNEIERALRVIPMGRKNWLFCWTEGGAKYVGIFQSLIVTCKMHGIDPYTYLVDVLQRVSNHPSSEVHQLTPAQWKLHFADNPLRSDLVVLTKRQ